MMKKVNAWYRNQIIFQNQPNPIESFPEADICADYIGRNSGVVIPGELLMLVAATPVICIERCSSSSTLGRAGLVSTSPLINHRCALHQNFSLHRFRGVSARHSPVCHLMHAVKNWHFFFLDMLYAFILQQSRYCSLLLPELSLLLFSSLIHNVQCPISAA